MLQYVVMSWQMVDLLSKVRKKPESDFKVTFTCIYILFKLDQSCRVMHKVKSTFDVEFL